MQLDGYERHLLSGAEGRLKRICMENIVGYAEILGADALCEVTKATVFCGAHNYLDVADSDDPAEVFARHNLGVDGPVSLDVTADGCYVQSCVAPCEQHAYEPFGQSRRAFEKNAEFLDMARDAGVTIAGTCSPYLTGWLPVRGEHFVTTESGVTVIGNSVFAAMGNSDGIEAAFWSAVCGRTPLWGNHVPENRGGTHVVRIEAEIGEVIQWELLGCAVGRRLPTAAKPVIDGRFKATTFQELRRFCTTLAISSGCELCHIPGITPEARTVDDAMRGRPPVETTLIGAHELVRVYESICAAGEGPIDFVSLGCPHYDIDQIKHAAMYLRGKTISPNVHFMIWTAYPIKHMADLNGYTETIESAGGHIYSSACPGSVGSVFVDGYTGFVFDSLKKADSVKSMVDSPVYYTDYRRCIDAAVSGVWKEEYRWVSDRR